MLVAVAHRVVPRSRLMTTNQPVSPNSQETADALLARVRQGSEAVKMARKKPDLIKARRFRDRAIRHAASHTVAAGRIVKASGLSATRVQQIINGHP